MSNQQHDHDDIPRFEPWLGVMGASMLPAVAIMYLPRLLVPLIVMTVVLFAASLVMLRRQTMLRSREQQLPEEPRRWSSTAASRGTAPAFSPEEAS
jgi:hypothetical protein